jgi:hypothetical protein
MKATDRFTIIASYSYYSGTFNAPKNGAIRDPQNGQRLEFDSRETAEEFLTARPILTPYGYTDEMGLEKNSDGSFSCPGTYITSHGEFSRPVYRIRKLANR